MVSRTITSLLLVYSFSILGQSKISVEKRTFYCFPKKFKTASNFNVKTENLITNLLLLPMFIVEFISQLTLT